MSVNGREIEALVEPRTLLIHFLREELNLTGAHIGCDTSHCGACTVDLDGKSVKSCTMFALQVDGAGITTIEGMEGASRAEQLAETDFRKIADPQAIAEAHALAARLAKKMRARLTRRRRAQGKRARLDMRRTIRRNICHGGVPIDLMWRSRKLKPLRLVVLLDVSGSM